MAYYSADLESAKITAYARRYGVREHDVLKRCRLETLKSRQDASIMTMPEEAAFLAFYVKAIGARRGLEVGVFTGYSSIALALAMPADAELVCCELDPVAADTARAYWQAAGVDSKVTCHIGPALDTLNALLADNNNLNSFDFAYIDANKDQYDAYYEAALQLIRPGGTVILDNMLWGGKVTDRNDTSRETLAIKQLNEKIHNDVRVEMVLSTMGDGVTFARKL